MHTVSPIHTAKDKLLMDPEETAEEVEDLALSSVECTIAEAIKSPINSVLYLQRNLEK